jgi:C1A family cysteine protease
MDPDSDKNLNFIQIKGVNTSIGIPIKRFNEEKVDKKKLNEIENKKHSKRKYGWKRDRKDPRDKYYIAKSKYMGSNFPPRCMSLVMHCPAVYDQGPLGSCTANAICALYETEHIRQGFETFHPSRLFLYYNERKLENTENEDSGAEIRDGMLSVAIQGLCNEEMWPYIHSHFAMEPPKECYIEALNHKVIRYQRINPTIEDLKIVVALQYPVVFGFNVYESFEYEEIEKTGIMQMPKEHEEILNGHAVVCIGYNDDFEANGLKGYLQIRNSWGSKWGLNGNFWMPYAFFNAENVDDPWIISLVTPNQGSSVKLSENIEEILNKLDVKDNTYETKNLKDKA